MYGEITKFHDDIGVGVIEAENGRKYRFSKSDIVSSVRQLIGEGVDFIVDASRPRQIVMLSGIALDGLRRHLLPRRQRPLTGGSSPCVEGSAFDANEGGGWNATGLARQRRQ